MTGSITSTACEWKQPFKEGKTTLEAKFKDGKGEESNATITIEGKDGKISSDRVGAEVRAHLRAHGLKAELISTAITKQGAGQGKAWAKRRS